MKRQEQHRNGTPSLPAQAITVASYNIHRCIGTDGRCNPERIAQVLHQLDAAVVALQEVDSHGDEGTQSRQMSYLAQACGLCAIPGPTIQHEERHYGNVLLTHSPPVAVRYLDLSIPGREPRGAIDADLTIAGETVRVIATHLGLRAAERRFQVKRLLELLAQTMISHPVIVLGDINEWAPFRCTLRWLNAHLHKSAALRSFPSCFPLFALDRIWVRPSDALLSTCVYNTALTRIASDHLPVKATIAL